MLDKPTVAYNLRNVGVRQGALLSGERHGALLSGVMHGALLSTVRHGALDFGVR